MGRHTEDEVFTSKQKEKRSASENRPRTGQTALQRNTSSSTKSERGWIRDQAEPAPDPSRERLGCRK